MHRDEAGGVEGEARLLQPWLRAPLRAPDRLVVLDRLAVGAVQRGRRRRGHLFAQQQLDAALGHHARKDATHALRVLRHQLRRPRDERDAHAGRAAPAPAQPRREPRLDCERQLDAARAEAAKVRELAPDNARYLDGLFI